MLLVWIGISDLVELIVDVVLLIVGFDFVWFGWVLVWFDEVELVVVNVWIIYMLLFEVVVDWLFEGMGVVEWDVVWLNLMVVVDVVDWWCVIEGLVLVDLDLDVVYLD